MESPLELRNFWVVSLLISLSFGLVFSEPSNKTAQFSSIEPTAENATTEATGQPNLEIVGGWAAAAGDFPYVASLLLNGIPWCAGTLYTSKIILTAAHCLYGRQASEFTVVVNSLHVKGENDPNARIRGVSKMYTHADFDPKTYKHDIAVMRLDSPITDVKPVMIPFFWDYWQTYEGEKHFDIIGWGSTRSGGVGTTYLMRGKVDAVKMSTCRRQYSAFSPFGVIIGGSAVHEKEMMCAAKTGVDTCQGDSGGPLLVWWWPMQVGITSFGKGCADPGYSGVYTRITNYLAWIADYSRALSD